jgi:hypothetical protein
MDGRNVTYYLKIKKSLITNKLKGISVPLTIPLSNSFIANLREIYGLRELLISSANSHKSSQNPYRC